MHSGFSYSNVRPRLLHLKNIVNIQGNFFPPGIIRYSESINPPPSPRSTSCLPVFCPYHYFLLFIALGGGSLVAKFVSDSCDTTDCSLPGLTVSLSLLKFAVFYTGPEKYFVLFRKLLLLLIKTKLLRLLLLVFFLMMRCLMSYVIQIEDFVEVLFLSIRSSAFGHLPHYWNWWN